MTRPPGDQGDAGFARQAAMGIGHVHGGGFVPDVNEVDAGVERSVENGHNVVAGKREDALAASPVKRTSDDVGSP
jgi:hypothetical protein